MPEHGGKRSGGHRMAEGRRMGADANEGCAEAILLKVARVDRTRDVEAINRRYHQG